MILRDSNEGCSNYNVTLFPPAEIADVLGAARDTDVMLINLHAQLEQVKSEDKVGVEWIIHRLQTFREQKQLELESFLQNLDEDDLRKQVGLCIQEGVASCG